MAQAATPRLRLTPADAHARLPVRIVPGAEPGSVEVTVRCGAGFAAEPEVSLTLRERPDGLPQQPQRSRPWWWALWMLLLRLLALLRLAPPRRRAWATLRDASAGSRLPLARVGETYTTRITEMPASVHATVEVRGRTRAGQKAAAIEEFVFTRGDAPEPIDATGPGGHVVIQLPGGPRRAPPAVVIGPGGLEAIVPPPGLEMIGRPYHCALGGDPPEPLQLEYRLSAGPHGLHDTRFDPRSLRLFRWNDAASSWQEQATVVLRHPVNIVTTKLSAEGVYAVFGRVYEIV